ncbi:MAG: hypothetical protein EAY75_17785 [Bacteroidetes bacterium]|nr:MAG: hypothetical protein EAY75_17785 [Bacteroidota bacterium]
MASKSTASNTTFAYGIPFLGLVHTKPTRFGTSNFAGEQPKINTNIFLRWPTKGKNPLFDTILQIKTKKSC